MDTSTPRHSPNNGAVSLLLRALRFAAECHSTQRRKDCYQTPYINHPVQVAETLQRIGRVEDAVLLAAAFLHDTVEDTEAGLDDLERLFGTVVAAVVAEVSDDKSLPKAERKRLQIEHAPHLSERAKLLKLADKICNIYDIIHAPPADWSIARRLAYLDWTEQVVNGLRGCNQHLEAYYDAVLTRGRVEISAKKQSES